jgi:hypothetical protein
MGAILHEYRRYREYSVEEAVQRFQEAMRVSPPLVPVAFRKRAAMR